MTFKRILKIVAGFYDLTVEDIRGSRRIKKIAKVRQIVCYLAHKEIFESFSSIGRELGGRNHATILYSSRKIASMINRDNKLKQEVDNILKLIKDNSIHFTEVKVEQEKNPISIIDTLERISKDNISLGQLKRQEEILSKYKNGLTFEEISKTYHLTRQRINQITEKALLYEVKDLLNQGTEIDPIKFIKTERKKHLSLMKKKHGIPKKKSIIKKEKRWSRYYDYCRKCATRTIKHKSYGYCTKCYPRTEIFKFIQKASRLNNISKRRKQEKEYTRNYYKRPEVINRMRMRSDKKLFGGNREKTILRDNERCKNCGISRSDGYRKYGRDLYVLHISNKKDNSLDNLITLCRRCFNKKVIKNHL